MKMIEILSALEGKEAPATLDTTNAVPEGGAILGKVPEDLRIIIFEAVRLKVLSDNIKTGLEWVSVDEIMKIRDEAQAPDADREAIKQRENTKEKEAEKEISRLVTLSEALAKVFWYELENSLSETMPPSGLTISKDWELYMPEDDDEESSQAEIA